VRLVRSNRKGLFGIWFFKHPPIQGVTVTSAVPLAMLIGRYRASFYCLLPCSVFSFPPGFFRHLVPRIRDLKQHCLVLGLHVCRQSPTDWPQCTSSMRQPQTLHTCCAAVSQKWTEGTCAADCLKMAQSASNDGDKAHLLQMAETWRHLVKVAEAQATARDDEDT
jgi:hypothetical protein